MKKIIVIQIFLLNFSGFAQESITWEKINGPLYPATPYSFLITSNGTQFVGTDGTGLFRSTDNGQTWELKNEEINGLRITCLAEAPYGWIYAGTYNSYYLYKSGDDGESWQRTLIADVEIRSIKFNSTGMHVYVGASDGFRISTDYGWTWIRKNNGLLGVGITAMEVVEDSIIYIATEQGIHKTTDEGNNWIPVNQGLVPVGQYIPTNSIICRNDTFYTNTTNAIYYSTNYGDQWVQRSTYPSIEHLQIDDNEVFYLQQVAQKKLLRSYDYGTTWDIAYIFPEYFMYYKVEGEKIYASVWSEGLSMSTDSATTFNTYFSEQHIQSEVLCFKIVNNNFWLAGTTDHGLFSSTNLGQTWQRLGPFNITVSGVKVNNQNEIYINCGRLYISTDDGNSWEYIPNPTYCSHELNSIQLSYNEELYASYRDPAYSSGVVVKLDDQNNWDSLATFIHPGGYCKVYGILVDKFEDAYLSIFYGGYYSSFSKTFKEFDNFISFQELFNLGSALAYNDSGYVFFVNTKVYRTRDRGNTIEEINNGISDLSVSSIKVIDFNEIYIGDNSKLYLSTNNGDNWYTIPGPSIAGGIHSIEKVGEGLLVIATKKGIYKNTTVVSIGEDGSDKIYQKKFFLSQNFPNPFNPTTSLQYAIGSRQFVSLKIYDVLGNEIATLVNEEKPAGTYEVEFNINNLQSGISAKGRYASGVYFYQLKTGNYVETKKMVLMK